MELRAKVLDVDLFQLIEQDTSIIPIINELLQKLANPSFGSIYQEFSQYMEILIDDIDMGFQQRKTGQSQFED